MSSLRHWIWLSTRSITPGQYAARLLETFGSPEGVYHADEGAYEVLDLPAVITFLPRIKCLLISWLQSSSAVILEPRKKSLPLFPHLFAMK